MKNLNIRSSFFSNRLFNPVFLILNKIIGDENSFSFQNRIFNIASLIVAFQCLISISWNYSLDFPMYINIILSIFLIAFSILYYYGRFKHLYHRFLFVILTLTVLSLIWILSEGLKGIAPVFYILAIAFFITISKSYHSFFYLVLTVCNIIILVVIDSYFNNLIVDYPSIELKELDLYFGYGSAFFIIYFFISYFKRKYDKENATIKMQTIELQELNATKDKFFSVIAHDLRSPFNSFLGLTEIMADESSNLTNDEIKDFSVKMRDSANNVYKLLENLLDWARIHQGLIPYKPVAIQLRPFVIQSITLVNESFSKKNIEISYDIPDDIMVFADIYMLQSIIGNLISNALKFTPKVGKVCISAKINCNKNIEISVKDNGIGMNQEIVDTLFNINFEANRKGTEGEPSTGLGLLLCKEFVEKHGGEIHVESKVKEGSNFKFTLPIYETCWNNN